MIQLGSLDLEILDLGIKKNGRFDEKDIENSNLKRLGIGRLLDELASLKERKFIEINQDGSFSITELAREQLWSSDIPLWVRILRLLEIKSKSIEEITSILDEPKEMLLENIEKLRKNHLVLMSPIRNESKLIKVYEILQDGIEILKKGEKEGFEEKITSTIKHNEEILQLIDEIISEINFQTILAKKDEIISKLNTIKSKLKI